MANLNWHVLKLVKMQIVEPGIPFSFLTEKSGNPYVKLVPLCQLGELFPWFNYFLLPHHKTSVKWAMGFKNSWASKQNCSCELVGLAGVNSLSLPALLAAFPHHPFHQSAEGLQLAVIACRGPSLWMTGNSRAAFRGPLTIQLERNASMWGVTRNPGEKQTNLWS